MTPRTAATAAGKRAAAGSRETLRNMSTEVPKRTGIRHRFAPANARRVSGPVRGRAANGAPSPGAARAAAPAAARAAAPAAARAAAPAAARATARAAARTTARAAAAAGARAPAAVGPTATRATARVAASAGAAAATAFAVAAEVAPRIVRPAPRITRPARPVVRPQGPARRGSTHTRDTGALGFVRSLPDHALTDRLVRGRAWIPVLGVLLVGIVALQVSLLRLNASMGRSIEQGTTLQTENGLLRAQVAALGNIQRIERLATGMGMVMATPEQISFLSPRSSAIPRRAIADMSTPSTSTLAATQGAVSGSDLGTAATGTASTASSADSSIPAAPSTTAGDVTSTGQAAPTGAPSSSTAATGADSTAATDPTPVGGDPSGATATQPAVTGVTGAPATGQQYSGGAASPGPGG